ncbi:MAG: DsbC family protein [Candidatus Competibacterales bacterium]
MLKALAFLLAAGTPLAAVAELDLGPLKNLLGGRSPDSVAELPVPGWYEVLVDGQIFYISDGGRYAVQGDIIDLVERENLTEERRNGLRATAIEDLGENKMVSFGPEDAPHTVTIFTDIDCGYCRKLHQEMEAYNNAGIRVRYLMFPRAGLDSESHEKAVTVWCNADRQDAMTRAKAGENLTPKSCANPVADHYALGSRLGVRGTPAIVLESGQMVPGYIPAQRLAEVLNRGN